MTSERLWRRSVSHSHRQHSAVSVRLIYRKHCKKEGNFNLATLQKDNCGFNKDLCHVSCTCTAVSMLPSYVVHISLSCGPQHSPCNDNICTIWEYSLVHGEYMALQLMWQIFVKVTMLFLLCKVISVAAEWHHVTPTLSSYFSYTLETDGMWAMCRVSPSSCGGLSGRVNDSPLVYQAWQRSDHPSWAVYPSPVKFLS